MPAYVTRPESEIISNIKATIMDRIHMGGTFLMQTPQVTVAGVPVAIQLSPKAAGKLDKIVQAVRTAQGVAEIVKNPMGLVQDVLNTAIGTVSGQLGDAIAGGKFTELQENLLNNALNFATTKAYDFASHTDLLSGKTSSADPTIPDFNKLQTTGDSLVNLVADETPHTFLANTASALYSETKVNDISDNMKVEISAKFERINQLDPISDAAEINTLVNEIADILNGHGNTLNDIITTDRHNFNEAGNTLVAQQVVTSLAEQYSNTSSMSYVLLNKVGTEETVNSFNTLITTE